MSLVKHLEEKIIDLVISEHKDKETYPNGMVQPGLLFIRRSDRAVLFKWAVRPVTWLRHWEPLGSDQPLGRNISNGAGVS